MKSNNDNVKNGSKYFHKCLNEWRKESHRMNEMNWFRWFSNEIGMNVYLKCSKWMGSRETKRKDVKVQ